MALSFSFLPGSILDISGSPLAASTVTVDISTLTTATVEAQEAATTMQKQVSIISYILISIIFLMMVKYSYPLLIFMDTLQLLFMHVYIVLSPLPYSWFKLTYVFKYFNFSFLPKLYTYDTTTTNTVQPYNSF